MNTKKLLTIVALVGLMALSPSIHAKTISFSGYTWIVRPNGTGGPGPNNWDENSVWVDANGYLHLTITKRNGKWYCSEVYTQDRLGFSEYQFWVTGRVDLLDRNVVLGLFNYPTPDVGPDATHEIDIAFAKWGSASAPIGNYTVWPTSTSLNRAGRTFPVRLHGDASTHRFTWLPTSVFFQSQHGHYDDSTLEFANWLYQPANPTNYISQQAMPVHINLWCFQGRAPSNRQQVELIIRAFKFTPR